MGIARIEWQTLGLAGLIYIAWFALTLGAGAHPELAVLGGLVIAWHGSLQHEATHGHPTRSPALNALIAGAPLSLWLPFPLYRESHLEHHATGDLTDPLADPESFYLTRQDWAAAGRFRRALARAQSTLAGRMLAGPAVMIARTWWAEARRVARGDWRRAWMWLAHGIAAAAVMLWVAGACGIHPLLYIGAFVYPGLSLTLLRSFAEHRPAPAHPHRSAVVEAHPLWAALFLNNNLHALHHAEPWRPWYQLPARYRDQRAAILAGNGGYLMRGYAEVARRYLVRVKDSPEHPRC